VEKVSKAQNVQRKLGVTSPFALTLLEGTECNERTAFRKECLISKHSASMVPCTTGNGLWESEGQSHPRNGHRSQNQILQVLRSLRRGFGVNYSSTVSWVMGFWVQEELKLCGCIRLVGKHCPRLSKRIGIVLSEYRNMELCFAVILAFLEPADGFHRFPWTPTPISCSMNPLRALVGKLPPILLARNKTDDNRCCLEFDEESVHNQE